MAKENTAVKSTKRNSQAEEWRKAFKRDWQLYLMLVIPLTLVIIFNYGTYPGLRMIFYNYKPARGWEGSEFVGLDIIKKVFAERAFRSSLLSTIVFNLLDLVLSFPMPIILALLLNELRFPRFKKVSQTILYLPHFLSWAIVGSVAYIMFRPSTGLVNIILMRLGLISEGIPFLSEKWHWAVTYLLINVWQTMGWGTIIYLAAIAGVSGDLYEAAMIDGADRWQRMWNITLPSIRSTVVTMLIMNLGKVMGSNLERLTALGNSQVRDFQYQLAVYIYERGLQSSKFSETTVVGLFQSAVGLILVLLSDRVAKKLGEDGLL
ncbi:MAG: sugar ABC transporter permease [Lachnospiraceae bacterium]|nr:sugar ABC transporter permease [Lachnospiraceae bacterium]